MALFMSINWATNLIIAFLTLTAIDGLGQVNSDMTDDQTAAARKTGSVRMHSLLQCGNNNLDELGAGVAYLYFIFAGFAVLAILFIHFYVPETKGSSAEIDSADLMCL